MIFHGFQSFSNTLKGAFLLQQYNLYERQLVRGVKTQCVVTLHKPLSNSFRFLFVIQVKVMCLVYKAENGSVPACILMDGLSGNIWLCLVLRVVDK